MEMYSIQYYLDNSKQYWIWVLLINVKYCVSQIIQLIFAQTAGAL